MDNNGQSNTVDDLKPGDMPAEEITEASAENGGGGGKTVLVDIDQQMRKSFLEYSMSVIVQRALPDVRDGLKPVHRRILYAMYEDNLTPERAYRKSATTVGNVLGRYHPHGDGSVYDAIVRLAQDFSLRYPLVDGHGNFGSIDGDPAAAYRYTEARMSKISMQMLTDIDKATVDYTGNFDDTSKEPTVLPSRFPNLLVNGSMGIAVGMATNIPPHNMGEVIDGVSMMIDNPDATFEDLMQVIKGPDFPTGGIIMGYSGIRSAYATGRGRIILRARTEIEEMSNGKQRIIITEIPYALNKTRLLEQIADLVKDKRVDAITHLRDESDRDGMRIVIELRRDANAQVVLNQLFQYSSLQDTVGVIMLALVNGEPKILSLKEMLVNYLDFQREVIIRRTRFLLAKAEEREHVLEGLKIALDFIEEVVAILRSTKGGFSEGRAALIARFGMTEIQANAIVQMRLGQLTGLEREKIDLEIEELRARMADLNDLLGSPTRIDGVIREDLRIIREKFGDERRTDIQMVSGEVDMEDLITEQDGVITLTHFGYIKRQSPDTYRTQRRGGRGISGMNRRDEDFVTELFIASTHDYILFFTNRGRVYRMKGYEIPEASRTARGTNIVNLLPLEADERIQAVIKTGNLDEEGHLVMLTKQGLIKRTELSRYKNIRKGGLIAIRLEDNDELSYVIKTEGDNELIVATQRGMAIRFNEQDARAMGRDSRGVRAIRLGDGDIIVGAAKVTDEDAEMLTVSEDGKGRLTKMSEYRLQSRGGKGIRNYHIEKNGLVAGVRAIEPGDDIFIISDDGVIIRIPSRQITSQSRYGGGVRVMRLGEGSKIVTLARSPAEEDGENTEDLEETVVLDAEFEDEAPDDIEGEMPEDFDEEEPEDEDIGDEDIEDDGDEADEDEDEADE